MTQVWRSEQWRTFHNICKNHQIEEGQVLARLLDWATRARNGEPVRRLKRFVRKGTTTESALLLGFCNEELKFFPPADVFDQHERVPDYFGKFELQNRKQRVRLKELAGEFEVLRLGSQAVEDGAMPDWTDENPQIYDVHIRAVGDAAQNFAFTFTDRVPDADVKNPSLWHGYVFATADLIYLVGVEPKGKDIVSCVLREDDEFGADLLIGVQHAALRDNDRESVKGGLRDIAVSRRIALFNKHPRTHGVSQLRSAAQRWVGETPLGSVVTMRQIAAPQISRG